MNYHPEIDPANPKFEPGLSRDEFIKFFPNLVQERPDLSKPDQLYCLICKKEICGKTGATIRRHLIGKYHILKCKAKTSDELYFSSFVENHSDIFKTINGQTLCKVCRTVLHSKLPKHARQHLTCQWHIKCKKIQDENKTLMENMTRDEFNVLLCESFAAAKIPFKSLGHPAIKNFIETISGMGVQHSSTYRELHLSLSEKAEVKEEVVKSSTIETQDHEDYTTPLSKETVKLEKLLQVKQRVVELVNSQPPKKGKKKKRDRDRQLKKGGNPTHFG